MTIVPPRLFLVALASLPIPDLLRLIPDDPADAARFRAVVGAIREGEPETLRATLDAFLATDEWQAVRWHGSRLADFGDEAVKAVADALRRHDLDERTVRDCYDWLLDRAPDHPRTIGLVAGTLSPRSYGREGRNEAALYRCIFFAGEHKVYEAHRDLRRIMEDREADELTRATAAKSLAELGEPDAVRLLYEAAGSDAYMNRHMAHLGFAAIANKTPDDFGDYAYGEGAMVSGGLEYQMAFDALRLAERRADRYRALAAFCGWLKAERPDLYKHLTTSF